MTTATPLAPTTTGTDTDLELILSSWDTPHCESEHRAGNTSCSHTPVARGGSCIRNEPFKVCQKWVDFVTPLRAPGKVCNQCRRPTADCFRILPL